MKRSTDSKKCLTSRNLTFILFFLVVIFVSALIIRPFFSIILISAILAYIFYPAYEGFLIMFKRKSLAAGTVILLLLLLVLFPLTLLVGTVMKESVGAYQYVREYISDGGDGYCADQSRFGCRPYLYLKDVAQRHDIDLASEMKQSSTALATSLVAKVSKFVLDLPVIFLKFFFVLFITYYFLKEGKDWLASMKKTLPLDNDVKDSIIKQFDDVMHATIYGAVVLSIIQGVVAAFGYFLLGAPSPLILGFLTLIATFLPYIGGALVWGPLALYMLFKGIALTDNILVFKAIGVFLFGLFIISTIDNILKPKIVGDKAKMHPLVILLGVFGGMAVFGIVGILIGPLVLALFVTSLRIYEKERDHFRI